MKFKKLLFKEIVSLLILILLFSGCIIKTNSNRHWIMLTKNGNVWHVDKMIITSINVSNSPDYVERIDTILDPGDFTFEGSKYDADDCFVKFDGNVKLHPNYPQSFGPINAGYFMAMSSIMAELAPNTIGTKINFDIIYLKNNKLRLYTPREFNPIITQVHDFNFTFECTRK